MPKSQSRCVFYRKTMLEYILLIKRYSWCAYICMVKSKHYWYQDKYIHCYFTQKSMPYIDYIYNLIILQPCLCHFGQYKLSPQQISCVQYVLQWRRMSVRWAKCARTRGLQVSRKRTSREIDMYRYIPCYLHTYVLLLSSTKITLGRHFKLAINL